MALMTFDEKIKSKLIREFDVQLQKELGSDLYSFLALVKTEKGEEFHSIIETIYDRDGPAAVRDFFDNILKMLNEFKIENSQQIT